MVSNVDELQVQLLFDPLKPREIEILGLLSEGLSNGEIAQSLHLTAGTVKWYNSQIFSKLMVKNRTQASKIAQEHDLLNGSIGNHHNSTKKLNNLPVHMTSYVQRGQEVNEIKQLIVSNRLVTLTGPGGSGKTRLALKVANDLLDNFKDGVWQVELAAVNDPALVVNTFANLFRVNPNSDEPLLDTLKGYLHNEQLLIIVDNFEHLLEAAPIISEILEAAPDVKILTTSRERLNLYGEQEFPVQSLALPDLQSNDDSKTLLQYEAIDLFIQRARSALPKFSLDEEQIKAVAKICVRLDGLPLAIELAASLVKIYPPAILAERLEDDMGVLPSGPRDVPARQQTLTATIEWSYNLLDQDQKMVFDRLAVFKGGAIVEAIEEICADRITSDIGEILLALVNKNLLIAREYHNGELRFVMLETILDYSKTCFIQNQPVEEIAHKHAAYFTNVAEAAYKHFVHPNQKYWFTRMRAEHENIHSALAWSLSGNFPEYGLRMSAAMIYYWGYNGYPLEGYRWTMLALEHKEIASPALLGRLLLTAGRHAWQLGNYDISKTHLNAALKIFEKEGDQNRQAEALVALGLITSGEKEDLAASISLSQRGLKIFRKVEDTYGTAKALLILGELTRLDEDYAAARDYYEESLMLWKQTGEQIGQAIVQTILGMVANHFNEHQYAIELIREGMKLHLEAGTEYGFLCHVVWVLAGPTAALGYSERAACYLGASSTHRDMLGVKLGPEDLMEYNQYLALVRADLGEQRFEQAMQQGRGMSFHQMTEYALENLEIEAVKH